MTTKKYPIVHTKGNMYMLNENKTEYLACTDNSILNLPLLPPVEEDVDKLALDHTNTDEERHVKKWNTNQLIDYTLKPVLKEGIDKEKLVLKIMLNRSSDSMRGFKAGYKAASAKKYSEEDMWKAALFGYDKSFRNQVSNSDGSGETGITKKELLDYLQSLTPKPVAIEVEMRTFNKPENGHMAIHLLSEPKTIDNVIQGRYIYE